MAKFDDIVIGDFIDSYLNLTMKTFTSHLYVEENCSNGESLKLKHTSNHKKNFKHKLEKNI